MLVDYLQYRSQILTQWTQDSPELGFPLSDELMLLIGSLLIYFATLLILLQIMKSVGIPDNLRLAIGVGLTATAIFSRGVLVEFADVVSGIATVASVFIIIGITIVVTRTLATAEYD